MPGSPRSVLKLGKHAVIWLARLRGSNAPRYFVEGRGEGRVEANDFGLLAEALSWFDALERGDPLPA
jgi:hypothetical protein